MYLVMEVMETCSLFFRRNPATLQSPNHRQVVDEAYNAVIRLLLNSRKGHINFLNSSRICSSIRMCHSSCKYLSLVTHAAALVLLQIEFL